MSALGMGTTRIREHHTLMVGALAIVAILALGRALPAWRQLLTERREAAEASHAELTRAEHSLARHAALRDTLVARRRRLDSISGTLLPGGEEGAAGRALAAMVSGAAVGADVRLALTSVLEEGTRAVSRRAMGEEQSARPAPVSAAPHRTPRDTTLLRTVAVRIVGTGDVRGVTTLLHTIERGPMRLRVRSMAITQPEVAAGDERVEALQLDMVVEGLAVGRARTGITGAR